MHTQARVDVGHQQPNADTTLQIGNGVTISAYLRERRLDEAQSLLRRTNLSVTEVGSAVGHPDPSHFTRMFREQTGLTPQHTELQSGRKPSKP
ncbi:MAG: hypothetical protein CM15mP74_06820 [Halieaceae bacterium]|nr:MAG: hypothetical protein CM15mP74_06820 [Halieaceae bacterium]